MKQTDEGGEASCDDVWASTNCRPSDALALLCACLQLVALFHAHLHSISGLKLLVYAAFNKLLVYAALSY